MSDQPSTPRWRPQSVEELIRTSIWSGTSSDWPEHDEHVECGICQEPYPPSGERPIELFCGHVVGEHCITHWLEGGENSCPYCRNPPLDLPLAPSVDADADAEMDEELLASTEESIRNLDERLSRVEEDMRRRNEFAHRLVHAFREQRRRMSMVLQEPVDGERDERNENQRSIEDFIDG
ncbi:MAG: hypothetical protein LQ350_004016 [Teloschistes chrysophthalmus]|nr:MAG: hypothetical protein LQ350_004016 [Niorma chrysophthalma]